MERDLLPPTPENIGGYVIDEKQLNEAYVSPTILEYILKESEVSVVPRNKHGEIKLELLRFDHSPGHEEPEPYDVVTIVNSKSRK